MMPDNISKIRKKISNEQTGQLNETYALLNRLIENPIKCPKCVILIGVDDGAKSAVVHLLASNGTTEKTVNYETLVLPKLVTAGNETFIVYPDLNESQNPVHDVAATVFVKNFLHNTSDVKIAITASYRSVTVADERTNFIELLEHLKKLFTNVSKFQHSITLVITNADNQLTTFEVKRHIASSLRDIQSQYDLRSSLHQMLLSIFLIEQNGHFARMVVLGEYTDDDAKQQHERQQFSQLFAELSYTPLHPSDFRVSLADSSKPFLSQILYDIDHSTRKILDEIFDGVRTTCQLSIVKFEKLETLNLQLMQLQNLRRQTETMCSATEFTASNFLDHLLMAGFDVSDELSKDFNKQEQYLVLLQNIDAPSPGHRKEFEIFLVKIRSYEYLFATRIFDLMNQLVNTSFDGILTSLNEHFQRVAAYSQNMEEVKVSMAALVLVNGTISDFSVENFLKWVPTGVSTDKIDQFKNNIREQFKFMSFMQNAPELASILEQVPSDNDRYLPKFVTFAQTTDSIGEQLLAKMLALKKNGLQVTTISDAIKQHCDELVEQSPIHESQRLKEYMTDNQASLARLISEVKIYPDYELFSEKISHWMVDNKINVRPMAADRQARLRSEDFALWVDNMQPAADHLAKLSKWYHFVDDLIQRLFQYDTQQYIDRYETSELTESNRLKIFLAQINATDYDALTTAQESTLNTLIQTAAMTMRHDVACQSDTALVLHGHLMKLSHIEKLQKMCSNAPAIYIFASHTIFIDTNLDFSGQGKSIYMIAPTWVVIGEHTINLDGAEGQRMAKASAGVDGLPGYSGGAGGNFFGIGSHFINGSRLTISVSGGNAGNGQEGGDGIPGLIGLTPPRPEETSHQSYDEKSTCTHKVAGLAIAGYTELSPTVDDGKTLEHFYLFGTNGKSGSDAGRGGQPGASGPKGTIEIFELNAASNVTKISENGNSGIAGLGGIGGKGGRHGNTIHVSCRNRVIGVWVARLQTFYFSVVEEIYKGKAADGQNGTVIVDTEILTANNSPVPHTPYSNVAEQYKQVIGKMEPNQLTQSMKAQFLEQLSFIPSLQRRHRRSNIRIVDSARSSASAPSSLVNNLFGWLSVTSEAVLSSLRSFQVSGPQMTNSRPHSLSSSFSSFSGDSTLLLMDLIARKVTKSKPTNSMWESTDLMLAQIDVLNEEVDDFSQYLELLKRPHSKKCLEDVQTNTMDLAYSYYLE